MNEPRIQLTNDGSHTLLLPGMNETYHSTHGALSESQHVFIKHGFRSVQRDPLFLLEVGMGTGLNTLLTILAQLESGGPSVHYHTLEPFPLDPNLINRLNYPRLMEHPHANDLFQTIHQAPWEKSVQIRPGFTLKKWPSSLEDHGAQPACYDLIYFDAFAPNKQAEVWSLENLEKCFRLLREEGLLVTYCAQGQFRRNLQATGYRVEKRPGPPGKREMIRAWKPKQTER